MSLADETRHAVNNYASAIPENKVAARVELDALLDRIRQLEKDAELGALLNELPALTFIERNGSSWRIGKYNEATGSVDKSFHDSPQLALRAALGDES